MSPLHQIQKSHPAAMDGRSIHCHRIHNLEERVVENGGALITGPAGTGKTYFVNRLISKWKEREQVQFILGAPTHMAARLLMVGTLIGCTLECL